MNFNCLELTENEINALNDYQGLSHKEINCLLNDGLTSELSYFFSKASYFRYFETTETLINTIKQCELIYSAMVKTSIKKPIKNESLYRGTTKDNILNKSQGFLSTTTNYEMADNYFSNVTDLKNQACARINIRENIPYYNFKNNKDYGNNFEEEIVLAPFLKFEIKEINNNSPKNYYNINVTKEIFKDSDITLDEILKEREKQNLNLKQIVNNQKLIEENKEKYENLNEGMHKGFYDRSDYPAIREKMDNIIDDFSKLKKENETLEQEYNQFKNKIQLYLKSNFLIIENTIKNQYQEEFNKQQEFLKQEKLRNESIEKNKLINLINIEINKFYNYLKQYQEKLIYLNSINKKYNFKEIELDINNIINTLNNFSNNIKNVDNYILNSILINLKTNNFEEFFNNLEAKENHHICMNIKKSLCHLYKDKKLEEIENELQLLSTKKSFIKKTFDKITGKEKKEINKMNILSSHKDTLLENEIYNFDFLKANLTNDQNINNKILEDINFFNEIFQNKNCQNINIDSILTIFDINKYNKQVQINNEYELEERKKIH